MHERIPRQQPARAGDTVGLGWRIRAVRPDDAPRLGAFFRALSSASRQRRFHIGLREVPPAWLERFTHPEVSGECALVAVTGPVGDEVLIGEARYAFADDAPASREFALAVADDWQGFGLGHALLRRLARHAMCAGIARLHGDVLRENLAMIALARRAGYRVQSHPNDVTLVRVVTDLHARPRWNPPLAPGRGPLPAAPAGAAGSLGAAWA